MNFYSRSPNELRPDVFPESSRFFHQVLYPAGENARTRCTSLRSEQGQAGRKMEYKTFTGG